MPVQVLSVVCVVVDIHNWMAAWYWLYSGPCSMLGSSSTAQFGPMSSLYG